MPLSWSAGTIGDTFVGGIIGTDPFGPKAPGVNALNPFEQIATAPDRAIIVAKVAAAPKIFAEVETQGESLGSALTRTVNGWYASLHITLQNILHLVEINRLIPIFCGLTNSDSHKGQRKSEKVIKEI
jgi:hypothetical protein